MQTDRKPNNNEATEKYKKKTEEMKMPTNDTKMRKKGRKMQTEKGLEHFKSFNFDISFVSAILFSVVFIFSPLLSLFSCCCRCAYQRRRSRAKRITQSNEIEKRDFVDRSNVNAPSISLPFECYFDLIVWILFDSFF